MRAGHIDHGRTKSEWSCARGKAPGPAAVAGQGQGPDGFAGLSVVTPHGHTVTIVAKRDREDSALGEPTWIGVSWTVQRGPCL